MPSSEVFTKFKRGTLRSGSKRGKKVTDHRQAVAIYISERRAEKAGKGHGRRKKRASRRA